MILAMDVGNTNIVLGCIEEGEILHVFRIQTEPGRTEMEYAIKIKQLMELYGLEEKAFEGAILSSVVPPVTGAVASAVKLLTGCDCLVVGPGVKTGLNIRIDDPGTLAGDLLVGSVAALEHYGAPVMVLDMGTATTLTVVDRNRSFIGGAILAGVKLSLRALAEGTSLLPDISIQAPRKCIASNTVDCMRAGAVYGTAAMVDGLIDRMEAELGYSCPVVATGGLARSITSHCRREILYDEHLLLKGLWALYRKNRPEGGKGGQEE